MASDNEKIAELLNRMDQLLNPKPVIETKSDGIEEYRRQLRLKQIRRSTKNNN